MSAIVETGRFRLVKELPSSLVGHADSDRVVIFESF
jgi:hypothetical protein